MQVYEIKGFSGIVTFVVSVIGLLGLVIAVPSVMMMVGWNAIVFEGFSGPEIGVVHGLLLWTSVLLTIKLLFNPQIEVYFKKVSDPGDMEKHVQELKQKKEHEKQRKE